MWTILQGKEDVGDRMASADANLMALDGRKAVADQIARAARVHLQTISGATNLQREIGTKTYILSKLFGNACPLVQGYASVISWIDENLRLSNTKCPQLPCAPPLFTTSPGQRRRIIRPVSGRLLRS